MAMASFFSFAYEARTVTVHRGASSTVLPVMPGTTVGRLVKEVAMLMRHSPDQCGLSSVDGDLLDLNATVPTSTDALYLVLRNESGYEAPQRPVMASLDNSMSMDSPPFAAESLTQRLPPSLAQFVMDQRPSPVAM
jgi:hypothetical protein